MKHWERVKFRIRCIYGCDVAHPEWVYCLGRFFICEPCAAKQGISRPAPSQAIDARTPDGLVPASPAPAAGFTGVGELAAKLKAAPDAESVNAAMRGLRGPRRRR